MMTINMMRMNLLRPGAVLACVTLGLAACGGNPATEGNGPTVLPGKAESGFEARSACGNDPMYTIQGKSYKVLETAAGYSETGTAAWYGAEYQGTQTAGCEAFDMNAYSAAHRTLPIPSFVRVTNKQNGQNVIVRVNDRGPFEGGDLIQLSFAAANALGIHSRSGAPVKIEALSPEQFKDGIPPTLQASSSGRDGGKPVDASGNGKIFYVVAGKWSEQNEAIDMFVRLTSVGLAKTEMATAKEKGKTVHQIRIGPLYNQDQIDNVKDTLESNGLASFRVVAQ
jgi:rare lipoprotein A